MQLKQAWLCLLGFAAIAPCAAQKPPNDRLIVHEWGTFLTMSGSDGVTLDGMYHEEHALPDFVHARSKDQLRLHSAFVKGETPVIYFYTGRRQEVTVRVDFPGGLWTQWYPQARLVGPSIEGAGTPPQLHNGHIEWGVEIRPDLGRGEERLPHTAKDALWNYARDVDAALVRTTDEARSSDKSEQAEYERFLFYRGLGRTTLPLEITSDEGGTLTLSASMPEAVRHLFVLRVENGRGAYRHIAALEPGATVRDVIPAMTNAKPLAEFTHSVSDALADALASSGLYDKEAKAMVNTWRNSYFGQDGIRVLYVLPQTWTDRFIPMQITPRPTGIVRVMVGRTELLTPEREARAAGAVRDLASPETAVRERAFAYLRDQGRYVEPILRRVQRTSPGERVRTVCSRLLLTGFVNELRTATLSAADGGRLTEKPVYVHAQLASVLREVGLTAEARSEAIRVLNELDATQAPQITDSRSRLYLRAYCRAMEGMGDDGGAATWYAKFIRFGSQTKTCSNCHAEEGPRNMAFYRDWWAGKRYAEAVIRTGKLDQTIAEHRERLTRAPDDTPVQMMLAYLYAARGDGPQAAKLWAAVEGRTERTGLLRQPIARTEARLSQPAEATQRPRSPSNLPPNREDASTQNRPKDDRP